MFSPGEETSIDRSVVFFCFHGEVKLWGGDGPLALRCPRWNRMPIWQHGKGSQNTDGTGSLKGVKWVFIH